MRDIPGATPQLRNYHFHGEFWWPTGVIIMEGDLAAMLYIHIRWLQFSRRKKKKKKKKQTQKQGLKFGKCVMVGGWVVVRPEYDVLKVFLQIRIACDTLLSDTLQRSSSAQTDGKNKWSDW